MNYIPSCFLRHKNKLMFMGSLVGGIIAYSSYLSRKHSEYEKKRKAEATDCIKRNHHFDSIFRECDRLLYDFSLKIRQKIYQKFDDRQIKEEIKNTPDPEEKIKLWGVLKVTIFSRIISEIYINTYLALLISIQLMVISGLNFANTKTSKSEKDDQMLYLANIEKFMNHGVHKLMDLVKQTCEEKLANIKLTQALRLSEVKEILDDIKDEMDTYLDIGDSQDIYPFPIGKKTSNSENNHCVGDISIETNELLQCGDFKTVFNDILNCGFSCMMDMMSECYFSFGSKTFTNINNVTVVLARLLPAISNSFDSIKLESEEAFVNKIMLREKFIIFVANIYESFSHKLDYSDS